MAMDVQNLENIRFALALTGQYEELVDDDDIYHALDLYPKDWRLAGAFLAESLAARALHDPASFTLTGVMSVSWEDRAASWRAQAKSLREQVLQEARDAQEASPISLTTLRRAGAHIEDGLEYTRSRSRHRTLG